METKQVTKALAFIKRGAKIKSTASNGSPTPKIHLPHLSSFSYEKYPSEESKSSGSKLSLEECKDLEKKCVELISSHLFKKLSAKRTSYKLHKRTIDVEYGAVTIEMQEGSTLNLKELLIKNTVVQDPKVLEGPIPLKFDVIFLKEIKRLMTVLRAVFKNPTFIFFNGADRNINKNRLTNSNLIAAVWINPNDIKDLEEEKIYGELEEISRKLTQTSQVQDKLEFDLARLAENQKDQGEEIKAQGEGLECVREEVKCVREEVESLREEVKSIAKIQKDQGEEMRAGFRTIMDSLPQKQIEKKIEASERPIR